MRKSILSALLLAATLLTTALTGVSCGSSDNAAQTASQSEASAETAETSESAAETEAISYDIGGIDCGGCEFRMINYDNQTENQWADIPNDLFSESESGDVLNDSVYKRNAAVEEALNVKLSCEDLVGEKLNTAVEKSVLSGSDSYDAVFPRMYNIPTLVQKELLIDLNTVAYFDFS